MSDTIGTRGGSPSAIGLGFRFSIADWILENRTLFEVLELTVDHYILGGDYQRALIRDVAREIPLTAHGIGLSIGTDVPLDRRYLEQVATVVDVIGAPSYSEHLAFTKVPGLDLANLLPLPRTEGVAAQVIDKVRVVQSVVGVPFHLENISYVFDYPDSEMTEADFLNLICRETGAGVLLDVENLHVNAENHGLDPGDFLNALPAGIVKGIHTAGGTLVETDYLDRPFFADTHDQPVPDAALDLLDRALERQKPDTIVLERDDGLDRTDQIAADMARLRRRLGRATEDLDHEGAAAH